MDVSNGNASFFFIYSTVFGQNFVFASNPTKKNNNWFHFTARN